MTLRLMALFRSRSLCWLVRERFLTIMIVRARRVGRRVRNLYRIIGEQEAVVLGLLIL